jgi:hypothetical protein
MKYIILILFIAVSLPIIADTVIGKRCYRTYTPNAPQDDITEVVWTVEKGDIGSGNFSSVGYAEDINRVRTPIMASSARVYDSQGLVTFDRYIYGTLGSIDAELDLANVGDVQAMYDMVQHSVIFYSHDVMHMSTSNELEGTYRAVVWDNGLGFIREIPAINNQIGSYVLFPGTIKSVSCAGIF